MRTPVVRRKQGHPFKETARQDPYRTQRKPKGNPRCPKCGATSIQGRWLSAQEVKARDLLKAGDRKCPACRQLEDHYAMGVIELRGESWTGKKKEVMNTILQTEKIARTRNDQERILWIKNERKWTKVYVSLRELARHIGRELEKSFKGKTEYVRSTEESYLRVRWESDSTQEKQRLKPTHKSRAFRRRTA